MYEVFVEYECNKCGKLSYLYKENAHEEVNKPLCPICVDVFLRQHVGVLSVTWKQKEAFGWIDSNGNITKIGEVMMQPVKDK